MPFNSPAFLFAFLPAVLLLHALAPARAKSAVLLGSSLLCYAWAEGRQVLVMLAVITVTWLGARQIAATPSRRARRWLLAGVAAADLGTLAWFKYGELWRETLAFVTQAPVWAALAPAAIPVGISFYVFQALGYAIDVARGRVAATPSWSRFALFLSLFPQLAAGPIVRYGTIAKDLDQSDPNALVHTGAALRVEGMRRCIAGLAKKVLIADALAPWVDATFAAAALDVSTAWLAATAFGLQIYFDFSGYSDMAIGLGLLLGFRFPENFRAPFLAQSMHDFWARWHITLTTWLRDYVLAGWRSGADRSRGGQRWRGSLQMVVVLVLCGLWHGASWRFALWGLYHAVFVVLERHGLLAVLARSPGLVRVAYVQLVLALNWPLFRCADLGAALRFHGAMFGVGAGATEDPRLHVGPLLWVTLVAGVCLACVPTGRAVVGDVATAGRARRGGARCWPAWLGDLLLLGVFYLTLTRIAAGTWQSFLYFRF